MAATLRVTTRRTLEQAKHCIEEALSVLQNGEEPGHVLADVEQAYELLRVVMAHLQGPKKL
jgi:hypothetical protein